MHEELFAHENQLHIAQQRPLVNFISINGDGNRPRLDGGTMRQSEISL